MGIGTVGPVPGGRAVHQHGIDFPEGLVPHTQPLGHPFAKVLDEHVGCLHHLVDNIPPFLGLEVDRHASFVAVARLKVGIAVARQAGS